MSNNTLYSERMKMAEIISADSNILPILERLGIELGFGEATVADICRRYELSTGLFLIIKFLEYIKKSTILLIFISKV